MSATELITRIKKYNLTEIGNFIFTSVISNKIYFEFKGLINHPTIMYQVCEHLGELVTHKKDVCIAGIPLGGISYATLVSHILNLPQVLIREEITNPNRQQRVEGYIKGTKIILVEDIIATGKSVIEIINILKSSNINVHQIICIVDREQGGVDKIRELGYDVQCLYKVSDFVSDVIND